MAAAAVHSGKLLSSLSVPIAAHAPLNTLCCLQIAHLRSERDILRQLDHPLLVRMHGCCQDEQCAYFVLEYVPGA